VAYAKQQRKKGTLTKDEIVQCAFNLIANKGTEGCSMRALAWRKRHGPVRLHPLARELA